MISLVPLVIMKIFILPRFIILLLFCSPFTINSQHIGGAEVFFGKVLRHKEGLLFETPPLSKALSFYLNKPTNGNEAWHKFWGYPSFEGVLFMLDFGDQEVLGSAIGLAPGLKFTLKEIGKAKWSLHYATGIAFLNKPFDPQSNPKNNAIGSKWNNYSRLRLGIDFPISSTLGFNVSGTFNHFSNGLSSSPNSGINVYGLNVGLSALLGTPAKRLDESPPLVYRKWGFSAMFGMGVSEHSNFGGPNFPIYFAGAGGYWRYHKFLRLHAGLEYEFSTKQYEFLLSIFETEEVARRSATRNIVYVANELMFGDISMRTQFGFYTNRAVTQSNQAFYIKAITMYHPKLAFTGEVKPFVGIMLKSHFAVAEYIGFAVGVDF